MGNKSHAALFHVPNYTVYHNLVIYVYTKHQLDAVSDAKNPSFMQGGRQNQTPVQTWNWVLWMCNTQSFVAAVKLVIKDHMTVSVCHLPTKEVLKKFWLLSVETRIVQLIFDNTCCAVLSSVFLDMQILMVCKSC